MPANPPQPASSDANSLASLAAMLHSARQQQETRKRELYRQFVFGT